MVATVVPFTDAHMTRAYVGWLNDPETVKFSEQRHKTHDLGMCQEYVEEIRQNGEMWAIMENDWHVGNISAHIDKNNLRADISILIGENRGKGIGTKALELTCEGLKAAGMRRLTIGCMGLNKPMINIAMKNHFHLEAMRPSHFIVDKVWVALVEMGKFV